MARPLVSDVRLWRTRAGLSQSALAARIGLSRQALVAIEAGRQVPSTTVSLQLARALGTRVDSLFRLPGPAPMEVRLDTGAVPAHGRVAVGRVDGVWVAHPQRAEDRPADARLLGPGPSPETARVEPLGEVADLEHNVLVAGCAPLLGLVAARLERSAGALRATWIPADSTEALALLAAGQVHIAGVHLADALDPAAHVDAARRACPGRAATLVNLACWRQGLVVAPGNPRGVDAGAGLVQPNLRYVRRDAGAAAQKLFAKTVRAAGGALEAEGPLALDHADVARQVRWGVADVGVTIESVALANALDFLPLAQERFDLVVPSDRLADPGVARFLEQIDRPAFRAEADRLPGYDLSGAGAATSVEA